MPVANTPHTYGGVSRALHWLTALLIFTAVPLGVIASDLPFDTSEALARKAQLFSLHKTLGVSIFGVAVLRILWALGQRRPMPLHPERRVETVVAEVTHWTLYLSLIVVPLSGWVHHAATSGFAPILWPFGQSLPLVPQSQSVAGVAQALHWVFTKVLVATILLHVLGAAKHALFDRDGTLARMVSGRQAPVGQPAQARAPAAAWRAVPLLGALAIYGLCTAVALALAQSAATPLATLPGTETAVPGTEAAQGNWQVTEGSLGFRVLQLNAEVEGSFAVWSAVIDFSETPQDGRNGRVNVEIAIDSLTLGSVTKQALDAEFFDAANHPTALFQGDIQPADTGYQAVGTLTLRGVAQPVTLPFTLAIDGDTAHMQGTITLDRRDFGMGQKYPDQATVGFPVTVTVALTARRGR